MASHLQQPSKKSIEEMMKDLKVDPHAKVNGSLKASSRERSQSDATSCISSAGDATGSVIDGDTDHESLETYQGLPCPFGGYYGYYYPGYDGSVAELNGHGFYGDGMELQYPVMQAENGSLVYFMPGIQSYSDASNGCAPVNPISFDGQFVNQQLHSPTPVFASGYFPNLLGYGELMSSPYSWDPSLFIGAGVYGDGYLGTGISSLKSNLSSSSHIPSSQSKSKASFSSLNASSGRGIRNQFKSSSQALQYGPNLQSDVQGKGYFSLPTFPFYCQEKGRMVYPSGSFGKKAGAQEWVATEKVKGRSKLNSVGDFAIVGEQNHESKTANDQDPLVNGGNTTNGNGKSNSIASLIRRDQYNLADFPTKYDHALFFVIKSYSEDDIHKSVKYDVWSSTTKGNKKLDDAYEDAQKMITEKGGKCPVFLFFSVNASGQFCGVAEMIGRVNFEKSMDFWQQDKWTGYFPVKWHIIKDVPNPQLRHIILENNENKPVTNSRDTQEVRLPQGTEMLNIFKNYVSKTSILDDFDFYESREKVMLQKKTRPHMLHFDRIKKADNSTIGLQSMEVPATKRVELKNEDKAKE